MADKLENLIAGMLLFGSIGYLVGALIDGSLWDGPSGSGSSSGSGGSSGAGGDYSGGSYGGYGGDGGDGGG
ncbi:hypothetical protein [Streptosporangium sp. NPDC003464]